MDDFGGYLKAARLARGLMLEAVVAQTKIPLRLLEALERNDVSGWPAGPFARGFIRAYAATVGLDPEDTVRRFQQVFETSASRAPAGEPIAGASAPAKRRWWPLLSRPLQWLTPPILLIAYLIWVGRGARKVERAAPPVPQAPAAATRTVSPPAATIGISAGTGETPASQELILGIETSGDCWVNVVADGRPAIARLFRAGDRARAHAREEIMLTVGDAGRFRFTLNARPAHDLGAPGEVKRVRITRANLGTFY